MVEENYQTKAINVNLNTRIGQETKFLDKSVSQQKGMLAIK